MVIGIWAIWTSLGERHSNILIRYSGYLEGQAELMKETEVKKTEANRLFEEEKRKREVRENKVVEEQNKKEKLLERCPFLKLELDADSDSFIRMTTGLKDSLFGSFREVYKESMGESRWTVPRVKKKRYVEFVGLDKTLMCK